MRLPFAVDHFVKFCRSRYVLIADERFRVEQSLLEISAPEIVALRAKVRAATDEFQIAMRFHEAWRPAAFDQDLHRRIGKSYAANTFIAIRAALRREVLLALIRLWDKDSRSVGMLSIARALDDTRIIEALAQECEDHWLNQPFDGLEKFNDTERAAVESAYRDIDARFATEQSSALRARVVEAKALISKYDLNGAGSAFLQRLLKLRNERLAHRQVKGEVESPSATADDDDVESFYQDMSKLIHLLRLAVEDTHYDTSEAAEIHARHAKLFWAGARGEMTEGHPDYVPGPARS